MRDNHDDLMEAMSAAEKAFEESLSEKDLDPAYFDLELVGYLLDAYDLEPLGKRIRFEAEHKHRIESKSPLKEDDEI